jgi:integrase
MLATILETAKRERIISENPARGVKKHAEGKQERFLNPEEIARLGQALREAETENKTAREAIRFLLLTGLRRMEALSLRRAWVDSRTSCLRFTDTKSGAQLRPIGHEAVKLIEAQPIEKASPWVFPAARGDGHFVGLPKFLSRICKRSELEGVTVHVLRHTFSSIATEMGYSELTIAGLLGHSVPGVTARYAHVPDAALVQAANRVSARSQDCWTRKRKVRKWCSFGARMTMRGHRIGQCPLCCSRRHDRSDDFSGDERKRERSRKKHRRFHCVSVVRVFGTGSGLK